MRCSTCKQELPDCDFQPSRLLKGVGSCRNCTNEFTRRSRNDKDLLDRTYKQTGINRNAIRFMAIERIARNNNTSMWCRNCKYSYILGLSINHINGDGNRELRDSDARKFYLNILNGIRKTDDLEILCMNCQQEYEWERGNRGKRFNVEDVLNYINNNSRYDPGLEIESLLSVSEV